MTASPRLGALLVLFGGVVLFVPAQASAIPAFARLYRVPCSSCHYPAVTRRSEFGDAFRRAGYHWPIAAEERTTDPIEMRGSALLTTLLPPWVPLSVLATLSAGYSTDAPRAAPIVVGSPAVTLLFGAALGRHASVFGTWSGSGPPDELFVHFARLAGRRELNLRAGLFEQTTTLFKTNEALLGRFRLGSSALSDHSVGQPRLGVEGNGVLSVLGGRSFWAAGLVQNAGFGSHWDFYFHLAQKFGGMDFRGREPRVDLDAEPSFWDETSVTVATWAYAGEVRDADAKPAAKIHRLGVDAQLRLAGFGAWGGLMLGADRDLTLLRTMLSATWFIELSYALTSWLVPVYVYQYQDSAALERPVEQHEIGVVFLILEDLRGRAKFTFTDDLVDNEAVDLQLLVAF